MDGRAAFELELESDIQETPPFFGMSRRHNIRANVPLELKLPDQLSGDSDLVYVSVTYNGPSVSPCSYTLKGTNSRFEVVRAVINLNLFEANAPPPEPVRMVYLPTLDCPLLSPQVIEEMRWSEYYSFLHEPEMLADGAFVARDWTLGAGDLYARRIYQRTTPEAVETTTIILKHTPQ